MSVSAVANAAERTHETSSGSDSEDLDFSGLTETDDEDDALVRSSRHTFLSLSL